jgi:hypothetical protein
MRESSPNRVGYRLRHPTIRESTQNARLCPLPNFLLLADGRNIFLRRREAEHLEAHGLFYEKSDGVVRGFIRI